MTTESTFDPAAASGEGNYKGSRGIELNEVSLNGDGDMKQIAPGKYEPKGGYFRKKILVGKPKDQKPEEISLGTSAKVVFLKIRRKLVERGGTEGEIIRSTSEHNDKRDAVTLFETKTKEKIHGVAEDLRNRFEGLRTVQIVYALLLSQTEEPELVRLTVKGATLGSEAKADTTMDFYKYLGTFGSKEHFYEYETILTPVREEGKRSYYVIDFRRGEKLSDDIYALAMEKMEYVHNQCTELDTKRAERIAKGVTVETEIVPDETTSGAVDYPPGDINPDDIPF